MALGLTRAVVQSNALRLCFSRAALCPTTYNTSVRTFYATPKSCDWIRRNTPLKPRRHKIDKIYTPLEEEKYRLLLSPVTLEFNLTFPKTSKSFL